MKFLLKLICCLLVCTRVVNPAWSAFSVEDLRGFNRALPAPVAPYTKPDIDLMGSKDPSYFKNTTPSVWDADADSLLQPFYPCASYTVAVEAVFPEGVIGTKISPGGGPYAGMDLLVSALPLPVGGDNPTIINLSDFMGALRLEGGGKAGPVPSRVTTSDPGINNFIAAVCADLAAFQSGGLTLPSTITAVFDSVVQTSFPSTFTALFTHYKGLAAISGGQQYTYAHIPAGDEIRYL